MFNITHINTPKTNTNYLEIKDSSDDTYAKIHLNLGGSLQELTLNKKSIIKDIHPLPYLEYLSSGILFPFASRIEDAMYTFRQKKYILEANIKQENNAIHGFVYNKTFEVVELLTSSTAASIKIKYVEDKITKGFPFKYSIQLHYTITKFSLELKVTIMNNDVAPFPFTLGWHPYFHSSDLYHSYLSFDANKKIGFDHRLITNEVKNIKLEGDLQIKNNKLDDCYILNQSGVRFKTPDYEIEINSSFKEVYLQLYTPDKANTIAIEPCTGPSNSFNNQMGLQVLEAKEQYQLTWEIQLKA